MYPYFRLNEEERDEYDHDELIYHTIGGNNTPSQRAVFQKAHDRIYGVLSRCKWCQSRVLEFVQEAYEKPAGKPEARRVESISEFVERKRISRRQT